MNKEESDIDPNIWRQNAIFLEDRKSYEKDYKIDNNESITPTTDNGYLTLGSKKTFFNEVSKKLQGLIEKNKSEDFYKEVQGKFENQDHLDKFLGYQEKALDSFLSDKIFVKQYQYKESKTSEVLRFGIDTKHKDLKKELDDYNFWLQKELENSDAISNISNETNYKKFSPKYIKLTSFEELTVKNALNYLEASTDNIALVDILKRESKAIPDPKEKKKIVTQVGGIHIEELDTHTALLYKTTENKILVIDPNNPMFSAHIAKFGLNIEVSTSLNDVYKIYTRPDKTDTGYHPKLYRDCIDIAVKSAFVLKNSGNNYLNLNELMQSKVIQLVTNNSVIDKMTFKPSDLIRDKQSSDFCKIVGCNEKMQKFSAVETYKQAIALNTFNTKKELLQIEYNDTLSDINQEHNKYIVQLAGEYIYEA